MQEITRPDPLLLRPSPQLLYEPARILQPLGLPIFENLLDVSIDFHTRLRQLMDKD
jgi:hypothetical protein